MLAFLATNTAVPTEQVRRHQATVSATITEAFSNRAFEQKGHGHHADQRKHRQVQRDAAGNFVLE